MGLSDWPLLSGMLSGPFWDAPWYGVVCGQCVSNILSKGSVTPAQVVGCGLRLHLALSCVALGVPLQLSSLVCLHCRASLGPMI